MGKAKGRRPSILCLDDQFGRSPKTMKRHASGRDWSSLPADILNLIAKTISNLPDFINYSRVCTSWRSAAIQEKHSHGIKLPQMIFVTSDQRKPKKPCYGFFSPSDHRTRTINLPHVPHGDLIGSSQGWLVTVDEDEKVKLVNPLTGQVIPLVKRSCILNADNPFLIQLSFPNKVALSCSPTESNCLAMAILSNGRDLAAARLGDKEWTVVYRERFHRTYEDIVYHSGSFYAYESHGKLLVCDFSDAGAQPIPLVTVYWSYNMHLSYNVHSHHYLVSSEGKELFLVDRTVNMIDSRGCRFKVFRWEVDGETSKWEMIDTLDGRAFFLGNNSGICLTGVSEGGEKSCIYFTPDSDLFSPDDMGVHDLEDGSTRFYTGEACSSIIRPTWIVPRF